MRTAYLALVLVALFGCSQDTVSLPFAVVNGVPLSEDAVRRVVLVQARMMELRGKGVKKEKFSNWANSHAAKIIPGLISSELLDQAAVAVSVKPTAEERETVLASYNRSCGRKGLSLKQLGELFGDNQEAFVQQFEMSVRRKAYGRTRFNAEATDVEVAEYLSGLTNDLKKANMIDAEARKKGAEAYARLKNGESWEKVAKELSEDVLINENNADFYRDWATVDSTAMGYEALADALPGLKAGEFSKPIEIEEGLVIVKVNVIGGGFYELGRIIFRMAEPVKIPSVEDAKKTLSKKKSNIEQLAVLEKLKDHATISYPRGTNFVVQIWK